MARQRTTNAIEKLRGDPQKRGNHICVLLATGHWTLIL
jgi:hypothetical protein